MSNKKTKDMYSVEEVQYTSIESHPSEASLEQVDSHNLIRLYSLNIA